MAVKQYPIQLFSGAKLAARYGISSLNGDFWADERFIYLRDGLILPDDPPIFEPPDPPPTPIGVLLGQLPASAADVTFVPKLKAILMRLSV